MGLLDCVASPEERDNFDESERPFPKPRELSRSDHDISRRRSRPLFSSQASLKSLKNIRDIDFWRQRVLRFIFSAEGREDIRILKVPFKQLGYSSVTDFIAEIPGESFSEFLSQSPPDEGIYKDDKVFWVHDGIAEPGIFKWQGVIENVGIIGLQLDRKKAVPFGIHDGKGLFYCKPGHRALVPEHEVTPYKKFLRSFLGLPPRQDSLVGLRNSVRLSEKAIAAKNSKPGDRVFLPKEKQWATVQWIGKIEGETVVDLVYEPPKPEPGKAVSPDEPCISKSLSLGDFIGELTSEPNTPTVVTHPLQEQQAKQSISSENSIPSPAAYVPPEPPTSPLPESSDESHHSEHDVFSSEDDSENSDEDTDSDKTESDSEEEEESDDDDENKIMEASSPVANIPGQIEAEEKVQEIPETASEMSPKLPSPKRKGFFGFAQNKKQKGPKSPTPLKIEQKDDFKSLPELKHTPTTPTSKNSNLFGNLRFKKKANKPKKESPPEEKPEKSPAPQKKKSGLSSSWGALFKSKSKTQLEKLVFDDTTNRVECSTPIDEMIPPDTIPTPPPTLLPPPPPTDSYNERRIDRPEFMNSQTSSDNSEDDSENENERPEVSLRPEDQTSESETSDTDEEAEGQGETQNVTVHMHPPPPLPKTPTPSTGGTKLEEIKITTLEKEVVQEIKVQATDGRLNDSTGMGQSATDNDGSVNSPEKPSSVDRFKEAKIRNKPSSFGSFLRRIKKPLRPSPVEAPTSSAAPMTPPAQARDETSDEDDDELPKQEEQNRKDSIHSESSHASTDSTDSKDSNNEPTEEGAIGINRSLVEPKSSVKSVNENYSSENVIGINRSLVKPKSDVKSINENDPSSEGAIGINMSLVKPKSSVKSTNENESTEGVVGINMSLVKPTSSVMSPIENEGNQDGLVLELLDVNDQNVPVTSPPPVPSTDPPKRRSSRKSFTFSFTGPKRKSSQSLAPTTPISIANEDQQQQNIDDEVPHNENTENIDPQVEEPPKKAEEVKERKPSKSSSFRNSFKRTFSLTRSKKRQSIDTDSGSPPPSSPTTPTNRISKPRPVTLYVDNNEVAQTRESFRNKRPHSLVVDIKPWNMRHGRNDTDPYSSPSSDEGPMSPSAKSPNPALLPKQSEPEVPKHRIFTTPSIFLRKSAKKTESEPLIPKASKTLYQRWNSKDSDSEQPTPDSPPREPPPPVPSGSPPSVPSGPPPPIPSGPPPSRPSAPPPQTPVEVPPQSPHGAGGKLKSALKQRKEIDSIPKGLKINDRVLWYSGRGPIPGTVLRLFKDGTDKYTAMVKFDREVVPEEPLRLTREGDAYIVTVEELITPDMFEPTYANQSEINKVNAPPEPITPMTPSVRFDGLLEEDSVPEVIVTDEDTQEIEEHDLPPPFQEEEVTMACGYRRGIQCADKSCCLETLLFSMFYTTNSFDITMLYANTSNEDALTRKVRNILRKEIVDPLRRAGFCPGDAVKKLRDAVKPLSDEWHTLSTDAEVMVFILFDRALKLQKFISYSNGISDFLHQLVVDPKDLSKSTTVQHLFETSLQMMDKLRLKTVPTPALILEMPRSNDKLMQYKAVIPNLSLVVSHILDGGPRLCICGAVAKYECKTCANNVGAMSIVYCDNCKATADVIHFQLTHDTQLSPLNQPVIILDLSAIICVKGGHYFSFVKCGQEQLSPWVFFDGAELENPKVCIEQNLSMWLDRLERYPGRYQDALQYPLLTHILQDSHICIYQPREKSSSV